MSVYKIVTYPAPILRIKAKVVKSVSAGQREFLMNMAETMYDNKVTVGLAAEQVSLDEKLVVVDARDKNGLIKLINPVIKEKKGKIVLMEEGCMSMPGISVTVPRSEKVTVEAKDERGRAIILEADGFLARVIQHEIDHLDGKLIIDYLNPAKKLLVESKYRIKKTFNKMGKGAK
ncbi:MAG: peptide deformylase [Candidatus Omnitrophica bacterium]|nr:peptide deformylase [Candidatus Omnitrophota bacterium]